MPAGQHVTKRGGAPVPEAVHGLGTGAAGQILLVHDDRRGPQHIGVQFRLAQFVRAQAGHQGDFKVGR
jgi:hypothetical protein